MSASTKRWLGLPVKLWASALAMGALVVLLLYIQGTLRTGRVEPGTTPAAKAPGEAGPTAIVVSEEVEDVLEWPGTVQSRKVARISPKVMARILTVEVAPGDTVKASDVVATLDDRDLRAKVEQARSALAAVEADAAQARRELERAKALLAENVMSEQQHEVAETRVQSLDALVAQAADAVREAEVFLEEAKVLAPFDGVVAEKLAEPGDLATPGRPILLLQDPRRLRLEVQVPESCAKDARLGMDVRVRIDALSKEVEGKIDEVLPAADPRSRTFLVKASLPDAPDLRPGMFGRLLQDCGKKTMLLVPRAAVTAVGQIETVRVRGDDGVFGPRHVRTGKTIGDRLEVLSGLAEGDVVRLAGGP